MTPFGVCRLVDGYFKISLASIKKTFALTLKMPDYMQ